METNAVTLYQAHIQKSVSLIIGPFMDNQKNAVLAYAMRNDDDHPIFVNYGRHVSSLGSAAAAYQVFEKLRWERKAEESIPAPVRSLLNEFCSAQNIPKYENEQLMWYEVKASPEIDNQAYGSMIASGKLRNHRYRGTSNKLALIIMAIFAVLWLTGVITF